MLHDMGIIKKELIEMPPTIFATKWFLDSTPFIFQDNYNQYLKWRHDLAGRIAVDPSDIIITGSAGLGLSLNPDKNFKIFDSCLFRLIRTGISETSGRRIGFIRTAYRHDSDNLHSAKYCFSPQRDFLFRDTFEHSIFPDILSSPKDTPIPN